MTQITLAYSNHRPEILQLTNHIMLKHQVIILEEPPHPDFGRMLEGRTDLEKYLLEMDFEYPAFSRQQVAMLQVLAASGRDIRQMEPYLELLLQIQLSFAEGHHPYELSRESIFRQVYECERDTTRHLLEYYQAVRQDDFKNIIRVMQDFAKADAARFSLRDHLRAEQIAADLPDGKSIYIEAGPMHLLLYHKLKALFPGDRALPTIWFPEYQAMQKLKKKGTMYSPGDKLTIHYIFNRTVPEPQAELLCARALIYNKLVITEEQTAEMARFPTSPMNFALSGASINSPSPIARHFFKE